MQYFKAYSIKDTKSVEQPTSEFLRNADAQAQEELQKELLDTDKINMGLPIVNISKSIEEYREFLHIMLQVEREQFMRFHGYPLEVYDMRYIKKFNLDSLIPGEVKSYCRYRS